MTDATDPLLNRIHVLGKGWDILEVDQRPTDAPLAAATQRARRKEASSFGEPPSCIALVAKIDPDDVRSVGARRRETLPK
jgi:hypothetical protein